MACLHLLDDRRTVCRSLSTLPIFGRPGWYVTAKGIRLFSFFCLSLRTLCLGVFFCPLRLFLNKVLPISPLYQVHCLMELFLASSCWPLQQYMRYVDCTWLLRVYNEWCASLSLANSPPVSVTRLCGFQKAPYLSYTQTGEKIGILQYSLLLYACW